jgi:hypothetical protein
MMIATDLASGGVTAKFSCPKEAADYRAARWGGKTAIIETTGKARGAMHPWK